LIFDPKAASTSPRKPCHELDMRRVAELVDRRDAVAAIAAIDQESRVAGEGRGIAGHRDDDGHCACRELLGLRQRALPRRIEHDGIMVAQFLRDEWPAEKVARQPSLA